MSNNIHSSKADSYHNDLPRFSMLYCLLVLIITGNAVFFAIKLFFTFTTGASLNHVSGAWTGLAMDLSEGIFYRPLFSESIGFGGTRYFPLFFSLHALLIKLFGMPICSGQMVSLFSGVLLATSCFFFLRHMKVKPILAAGLITLLPFSTSIQWGLTTIRGDILPIALNIAGFACFSSRYPIKYRRIFTSICFTLAFSAKITAIGGVVSLFVWLMLNRRKKEALLILAFTTIGYIIFFSLLYFGTSGRIISIFSICSSGGANLASILHGPNKFLHNIIFFDPMCMLFFFWSIIIIFNYYKIAIANLTVVFFLVSTIITIIIFGSPGTDYNHLADIAVASILLIGTMECTDKLKTVRPGIYTILSLIILAIIFNFPSVKSLCNNHDMKISNRYPKAIINFFKQENPKVLAEDPMIPIVAGKRPYLLDPFTVRMMMLNSDSLRSLILENIDQKMFPAIVFSNDPFQETQWYANAHFSTDFVDRVLDNYIECERELNYVVYCPK